MSTYNLNTQISNTNNDITLNINLNKNFNVLSKSFLDLSSQNFTSIATNLDQIMISGSNYSSQIKGFLIERNYILNENQSHDYFVEHINTKENNNISLVLKDNVETSNQRNIFSLNNLVSQGASEFTYDISYFEIPAEEIIKSKTLLTDYLMRQYFYSQGKPYALTRMEKIAESLQNTNLVEDDLNLDFYKTITKVTSRNTITLFNNRPSSNQKSIALKGFFQNKNFLFKIETENYFDATFDINNKKIYRYDNVKKTRLLISDIKYKRNEYQTFIKDNFYYGKLLSKQKAKEYKSNTRFSYEIELTFNIYSSSNINYTIEKASIRL